MSRPHRTRMESQQESNIVFITRIINPTHTRALRTKWDTKLFSCFLGGCVRLCNHFLDLFFGSKRRCFVLFRFFESFSPAPLTAPRVPTSRLVLDVPRRSKFHGFFASSILRTDHFFSNQSLCLSPPRYCPSCSFPVQRLLISRNTLQRLKQPRSLIMLAFVASLGRT
jgi:hypothetical protein